MPRVPPFDRDATYADLEKLPDGFVAELVRGELHATPRPAPPHAVTVSSLGMELGPPYQQGRGGPGGWWILDEPELHLGWDVVVPDLAGWRRQRMPVMPATPFFTLAPDWICEVLSASTAAFDRERKLDVYAHAGVAHAWLVDPQARTLEVFGLDGGAWRCLATHGGAEVVSVEPFADITLALERLWA